MQAYVVLLCFTVYDLTLLKTGCVVKKKLLTALLHFTLLYILLYYTLLYFTLLYSKMLCVKRNPKSEPACVVGPNMPGQALQLRISSPKSSQLRSALSGTMLRVSR